MSLNVSLKFKSYPDDRLATFANTVYERMSVDTKYTALKPSVDNLHTGQILFNSTIANAALGGKDRTDDKNASREALIKLLVSIAHKIEEMTDDNPRVITEAGFDIRNTNKTPKEDVTEMDTPVLTVTSNRKGFAKLVWNKVPNAINYAIKHKAKTETAWQNGNYYSEPAFSFTNLESETVYEFQICALGPKNVSSDWTAPTSVWVP